MFVYQRIPSQSKPLASKERFFEGTERKPILAPNKVLVVASSLLFGGLSKLMALPLAAFAITTTGLAWLFADEPDPDEPVWVNKLSLAVAGLFYLGLGSCLGLLSFLGVGLLALNREKL
jgi:hypothetical protein